MRRRDFLLTKPSQFVWASRAWDWGVPAGAAAVACAVAVAVTVRHGLSLSPDSAVYLSSAEHLLEDGELTTYSGRNLVIFPPGFPTLVAAVAWLLGTDVAAAARIVNVVSLAVAVTAACVLVRRHVSWRLLQVAAAATFAAAAPLVEVAAHAWSESSFIALSLLAILVIEDLLDHPTRPASIAAVSALVSASFFVRYAGLALVLTAVAALLIAGRAATRSERLKRAAVTGAAVLAAPAAWIGRNLAVSGTAFGSRAPSDAAIGAQLQRTGGEVASWVVPRYVPAELRLAGIGLAAAAAVVVAARLLPNAAHARRRSLVPLTLFSATYLLLLGSSAAATSVDPLGARLLSPLFVPVVVMGSALLDRAVRNAGRVNRWVIAALALAVICWSALSIVGGGKHANALAKGAGYSSAGWRSSPLALRLRQLPSTSTLFSNRPDAVWATTRRDARCLPPQLGDDLCVGSSGDPDDLRLLESGAVRADFAWFALEAGAPPPRRRGRMRFDPKTRTADGALYVIHVAGSS